MSAEWTINEMMIVAAARELRNDAVYFVGIGMPGVSANLARATHAPDAVLVYESGCLGAKPGRSPLSIGDGVLADSADAVVSVPEVFNYWLQGGRIDTGFLTAAQVDRFGNLNTTVIGHDYHDPIVRLPGAGGAPDIAAFCGDVILMLRQSPRTFVGKVDFVTSVGYGSGQGDRERLGLFGNGPRVVITDHGILEPDPLTCEFRLTYVHSGSTVDAARAATGWDLAVAPDVANTCPPTAGELAMLRTLTEIEVAGPEHVAARSAAPAGAEKR